MIDNAQPSPPAHPQTTPRLLWRERVGSAAAIALMLALTAVAVYHGRQAAGGVQWPYDPDAFRDIAQAQVMLDGLYPADYFYLGETTWYHPLAAALVAVTSFMFGMPPNVADIQLGIYLNAIVPLAFFAMAWRLLGRETAVFAGIAYLFLVPLETPSWFVASYAPWFFAPHITQAAFYLAIAMFLATVEKPTLVRWTLTGGLLGLTFLGHAAPAILFGIVAVTLLIATISRRRHDKIAARTILKGFAVLIAAAFVVSLPLTQSILFRYGLRIENAIPTTWTHPTLGGNNFGNLIRSLATPAHVLAVAGLGFAVRRRAQPAYAILLTWLIGAIALLAYSYLATFASTRGLPLPQLVPGYHFIIYIAAALHLFFAVGIVSVTHAAVNFLKTENATGHRAMATKVVALITLVFAYQRYPLWQELQPRSLGLSAWLESRHSPVHWVREHTRPDNVFLCDDFFALHVAAAAGARVVCGDPYFSNLYCSWIDRDAARSQSLNALETGDRDAFTTIAENYRITHVLLSPDDPLNQSALLQAIAVQSFTSPFATIWSLSPETENRLPVSNQ